MNQNAMKANKKLLAALAVLAVAFVVFAAIPAVDATDSEAGTVEDGAVLANATVKTFEELVQANADSNVQRIDVPRDASIVINETFTAVKPIYFSEANAGSINVKGEGVIATFTDVSSVGGAAGITITCTDGASIHMNGVVKGAQIQAKNSGGELAILWFEGETPNNDFYIDSELNAYGTINPTFPYVAITKLVVPAGKVLNFDGVHLTNKTTVEIYGIFVGDVTIGNGTSVKIYKLGDMRVGGFRVIAITNITDSCYYTHNPSLSSWRGTSEKSKRS